MSSSKQCLFYRCLFTYGPIPAQVHTYIGRFKAIRLSPEITNCKQKSQCFSAVSFQHKTEKKKKKNLKQGGSLQSSLILENLNVYSEAKLHSKNLG